MKNRIKYFLKINFYFSTILFSLIFGFWKTEAKPFKGPKEKTVGTAEALEAHFKLAGQLLGNKKYWKATEQYRLLIDKIKEKSSVLEFNGVSRDEILARAYMGLGFALDYLGKDRDALKFLQKAKQLDSGLRNHLMLQITLGAVYGDLGLKNKEIQCYQEVIEINPLFHPAYFNLAVALGEIGRISEAIKVLERVIKIKPDYAKAIKQLAKGYEISQDFEKAIEYYLIAQRLFSERNNIKEKIQINNKLNTLLKKYGKTSYLLGIIFFPNV